jgi:hypothetical protein
MTVTAEVEGVELDFDVYAHLETYIGGSYESWDYEIIEEVTIDEIYFDDKEVSNKLNSSWISAITDATNDKFQ